MNRAMQCGNHCIAFFFVRNKKIKKLKKGVDKYWKSC